MGINPRNIGRVRVLPGGYPTKILTGLAMAVGYFYVGYSLDKMEVQRYQRFVDKTAMFGEGRHHKYLGRADRGDLGDGVAPLINYPKKKATEWD